MAGTEELFTAALNEQLAQQAPLAARMRPKTLDEVVGQDHLLATGRPLRALIDADRLSSVILWGPPGTGGPHRMTDESRSASIRARNGRPGASR